MSKPGLSVLLASIAFLPLITPHVVHAEPAQAVQQDDKTLSPFFVVEGAQPGVEALPLESTRADVHIAGVISDVTVTQTYRFSGIHKVNVGASYRIPIKEYEAMRFFVRADNIFNQTYYESGFLTAGRTAMGGMQFEF